MTESTTVRSEQEIHDYVAEIVGELAPNPDGVAVAGASRLVEDLGYHSLALLELAFTLEDEFDLPPIDEATARQITTVESVAGHVVNVLGERGDVAAA
ncbi:phosphopantetheine-binding protein [Planotetraspora sp. GP83]|uniref:phosphopantetheine-binding protein n=1 Tax=Planotetraspora sp. GP83 TaxID=3156264 RepID=UPI0035179BE5